MGKASKGPAQDWRGHIEQYLGGGLSRREYCQRHQLALSTFDYWRRRLRKEGAPATSSSSRALEVVRVEVDMASVVGSAPLELVVGNGRMIRIPAGFDAGTLERLLVVLEGQS